MAVGAALMVVGAGVQIYGQQQANRAEAQAQRANAAAYMRQKHAADVAAQRESNIFLDESTQYMGNTISEIARSGITLDGSALMALAGDKARMDSEYKAIRFQAAERSSMFDFQAGQANKNADRLSSSSYNNTQTLGTLLNTGASMYGMYRPSASPSAPLLTGGDSSPSVFSNSRVMPQPGGPGLFVEVPGSYDSTQPWVRR